MIQQWQARYWELVGHQAILHAKADDGELDRDEWHGLIEQMREHGMWANINVMRLKLMLFRERIE